MKHEPVPNCGSYEVRYSDGRPSRYFYFDDLPSRRLEQALKLAKAAAKAARD